MSILFFIDFDINVDFVKVEDHYLGLKP